MARPRALGEQSYVLKADKKLPEEQQTLWFFRALKHRERAEIVDGATRGIVRHGQRMEERRYGGNHAAIALCAAALTRVERFVRDGAALKVPTDRARVEGWLDENVDPQDLVELGNFVMGTADLTEEDAGNSASPSGSEPTSSGPAAGTRNGESAAAAS